MFALFKKFIIKLQPPKPKEAEYNLVGPPSHGQVNKFSIHKMLISEILDWSSGYCS